MGVFLGGGNALKFFQAYDQKCVQNYAIRTSSLINYRIFVIFLHDTNQSSLEVHVKKAFII